MGEHKQSRGVGTQRNHPLRASGNATAQRLSHFGRKDLKSDRFFDSKPSKMTMFVKALYLAAAGQPRIWQYCILLTFAL